MRLRSTTVEQKLERIASAAHGIVTLAEALSVGISASGIQRRVRKGELYVEYPGVYRVGHRAPSVVARYMAAVKACGKGSLLSGMAAGYLLGLLKGEPPPPEVTARTKRTVKGIKTRRSTKAEGFKFRGIPVTTVAQTLIDLAARLNLDELARACHEAGVRHRTTPREVERLLRNQPGAAKLRAIMRGEVHVTLSKLERRFLQLLREAGLPLPVTNKVASARRVDCRWPGKLTVELDSYTFHNSRYAWQQGHQREREARARREDFRRYTYEDVFEHPARMLAELREALAC
jgi:hypothetical protein